MTVQAAPSSLERELEYRKKLTSITNQINAAESIPQILMTLKDRILELLDAERLTIYAVDTKNQELYSLQKIGDVPKEIRVPKSFASIAGFTALARKTINIKDAYDAAELPQFPPNLRFDQRRAQHGREGPPRRGPDDQPQARRRRLVAGRRCRRGDRAHPRHRVL